MVNKTTILVLALISAAFVILLASIYTANFQSQPESDIFCGGIVGTRCPAGYLCRYEGKYPNASGKCVKNAPIFNLPTATPSATPTPAEVVTIVKEWKTFNTQKLLESTFGAFSLTNPSNWTLVEKSRAGLYQINLTKEAYQINIEQASVEGGLCPFPDLSPKGIQYFRDLGMTNIDYVTKFFTLNANNSQYRYYLSTRNDSSKKYFTLCQKSNQDYLSSTKWGFITMITPPNYNQKIFNEMLTIIKSIKPTLK